MFQLKQVACAYEQKKVFTGLDLEIRQGQYVMLMGENGTGKSSLISLLTGFKQEESGRILFLGKDLKEWLKDKRQKRDFYSRLGILFQDVDSQLFNCTVYDEIACLLYTSDAADDLLCVDLGGRRIIKKKKQTILKTT